MESVVNSFQGGMHSGIDPTVFPVGSYREMRNGHIFSRDENGFVVTNISAPEIAFNLSEGFLPIGSCEFNGILYIMSYNPSTEKIEFGQYKYNGNIFTDYSPLMTLNDHGSLHQPLRVSKAILGYSTDNLVEMFPRINYDGSVNLYICDGLNTNIIVNNEREYEDTVLNPLEQGDFNHFKVMNKVPRTTATIVKGGYLKPGNYFLSFRYTTVDLNSTTFINQLGPFCISEDDKGVLDTDNIKMARSIEINVQGMDPDYKYVEVAVIRYFGVNGAMSTEMFMLTKKYSGMTKIRVTGLEKTSSLSAEELLVNNIFSDTCKSHIQKNNRYYGAHWKASNPDLHDKLKEVAVNIIPQYVLKHGNDDAAAIAEANARDYRVLNSMDQMKYKPGEIYPFGVSFIIGGKFMTDVYPICGYDANAYTKEMAKSIIHTGGYKIYNEDSQLVLEQIVTDSINGFQSQAQSTYRMGPYINLYLPIESGYNYLKVTNRWLSNVSPVVFFSKALSSGIWSEYQTKNDTITAPVQSDYHGQKDYLFEKSVQVVNNTFFINGAVVNANVIVGGMTILGVNETYSLTQSTKSLNNLLPEDLIGGSMFDMERILFNIPNGTYRLIMLVNISFHGPIADPVDQTLIFGITVSHNSLWSLSVDSQVAGYIDGFDGSINVPIPENTMFCSICGEDDLTNYAFGNEVLVPSFDGSNGLYRFPQAKNGDDPTGEYRRRLFYAMMGVNFDLSMAKDLIDQYANLNITGIILMQGERIVNCVSQGISLPMIDRIIVRPNQTTILDANSYHINYLIQRLGDGDTKTMFPYLFFDVAKYATFEEREDKPVGYIPDYQNHYNFPIHIITWREKDGNHHPFGSNKLWGYVSAYYNKAVWTPDGFTRVVNGDQIKWMDLNNGERVYSCHADNLNTVDKEPDIITQNSLLNAEDFAFFSPDEMNDSENIFSGFIKVFQRLDFSQSGIKDTIGKAACSVLYSLKDDPDVYGDSYWAEYTKNFLYNITNKGLVPSIDLFSDANTAVNTVDMTFVTEDKLIPDDNGCISRMKSIFEIFGQYPEVKPNTNYINNNLTGKTRQELTEAGLMLNRLLFKNEQQKTSGYILNPMCDDYDYPFQGMRFRDEVTYNTMPVVLTNMSMKSRPYYHYHEANNPVTGHAYSEFIAEKYNYNPELSDVFEHFRLLFDIGNEKYHPIGLTNNDETFEESITLYKGDVFAQVVTFRLNRFNFEVTDNLEADEWRHGQVMQMYLESFKNHNLRSTTFEDAFWPFAETLGYSLLDFAFASNVYRLSKESMAYNEGYSELSGVLTKYGIDMNMPVSDTNKPNRVYWSNQHIDGSLEDAYRNIPTGNYKDFDPENGSIQRIINHNDALFIVQEKGISQLYDNNKMEMSEDSSSIIVGDPDILNTSTRELANYGTQHPSSVVVGENGIYGVDWMQKKIWVVNLKVSDRGSYFYLAEDLIETKSLRMFFKDLEGEHYKPMTEMVNDLFAEAPRGIVSGIDVEHNKVYFTFHTPNGIETLVYDEQQKMFIGLYDYTPNIYLQYRNKMFMYNRYADQKDGETLLPFVWGLEGGQRYDDFYMEHIGTHIEHCELNILVGATIEGPATITLNGFAYNIFLTMGEGTAEQRRLHTASEIASNTFGSYVVTLVGSKVLFDRVNVSPLTPAPLFDVKETEVDSSFSQSIKHQSDNNRFKLVFYVNGMGPGSNLSNLQKEYILHRIFASDNLLKTDTDNEWARKFEWETEYQQSSLDLSGSDSLLNDSNKFWKTPTFEDHMWNVPIDVQSSVNKGPNGTSAFNAFEAGASMRGSWLKVTITYSGNEKIFIKNCITNFLNSYS